jgi:hypothetical protein
MNFKTKIFLSLLAVLVIFSVQCDYALAGFGVSPPSLSNKNLVPGSFYEQDIYLVQSQPDQDLNAVIKIDAGQINDWIKIENGNTFVIPKGTQQFPMKVSVSVPADAELGVYKGTITVSTSPVSGEKNGVSVVLGASISINLNVGEIKVSDFSIKNFQIPDVAKGSPIKFTIKVENSGNIDNGPTKVGLTFFDQYHSKQLGEFEKEVTEKVKSFQTKDISVEFPNNLETGSYWADVKIYNNDDVIINSKIVFAVVDAAQIKSEEQQETSVHSYWIYILIFAAIIIVLVILALVILILRRKRRVSSQPDSDNVKKIKIHK